MRRMYGDFRSTQFREPPPQRKRKRDTSNYDHLPGIPDITAPFNEKLNLYSDDDDDDTMNGGDSYFGQMRQKRQTKLNKQNREPGTARPNAGPNPSNESTSGR